MKALYILLLAGVASQPVSAQPVSAPKTISNGTTAASSPLRAVPTPAQATVPPLPLVPRAVPTSPPPAQSSVAARNPMLPPVAAVSDTVWSPPPAAAPHRAASPHEQAFQASQAALARQGGNPNIAPPGLPPFNPDGAVPAAEDPIKANGKRIGAINGNPIFKLEEAYYFEKTTNKTK